MKKTPWFPGDVKPVRPGVYERQYEVGVYYSQFDGSTWRCGWRDAHTAINETRVSPFQANPWRGLAAKTRK